MNGKSMPTEVAGYPLQVVSAGKFSLGHVEVEDGVSVVFRMADDGGGPELPSGGCLACVISNISACTREVCPPIKANDPDASCSEEIRACAEQKCSRECGSGLGAIGGFMVIA